MSIDVEGLRLRITGSSVGLSQAIDGAKAKVSGMIADVKARFAALRQSGGQLPSVNTQATPAIKDPFSAFRASSANAQQQVQAFTNSVRQSNADLQSVTFGGLAAKLAAVVGAASLARNAIKLSSDAQQTATSLKVLLGSASKAADMIRDLRTLAASSPPLQFQGLSENAKLMLNFGITAKNILPNLRILGDITGGNAEKMYLMSLAFSQSSAAGRLMGQDLLQMINSGFNPLLEISERTGVSMVDLKKRMEDGNISFAAVRAAFQSATAEGGRFAGMMTEQSKTFAGAMGKLKDAWQLFLVKIGNEAIPHLSNLAANLTNLINATGGLSGENVILAAKVGAFLLVFQKVITVIPKIIAGFQAIAKAQAVALALSGPSGWATLAIGIAAASAAVYTLDRAFAAQDDNLKKSTTEVVSRRRAQDELNKAMGDTVAHMAAMAQMSSALADSTRAEAEALKKRIALAEQSVKIAQKIAVPLNIPNPKLNDEQIVERNKKRNVANEWVKQAEEDAKALREQLDKLNGALDSSKDKWAQQADASRKAFQLPIDKLKEQLTELQEQVKQGGLEIDVFERASAKALTDYKTEIANRQPQTQPTQFAGIVAGSQADVQTVFRFQTQYNAIGSNDKQEIGNELLRQIRQELINIGKISSQPPSSVSFG